METQTLRVRKVGSLEAIGQVQILHIVRKRLSEHGYRPVLPADNPNVGDTLLRVEARTYYLSATVNTDLDKAPGVRFATLRTHHVTAEGLERILRVEYDYANPENNEVRWFTKIEGLTR